MNECESESWPVRLASATAARRRRNSPWSTFGTATCAVNRTPSTIDPCGKSWSATVREPTTYHALRSVDGTPPQDPAEVSRDRLDHAILRLPVARIRSLYGSDASVGHTKHLLEAEDHRPRVVM